MTAGKGLLRGLGAAALATGVLAAPAPARAAEDYQAPFVALTELDASGQPVVYPIPYGATPKPAGGAIVLGVTNVGPAPLPGAVVEIRSESRRRR
jgi:hypothetical protein